MAGAAAVVDHHRRGMATRLERLLAFLDTGTTPTVRLTAARQLGALAATRVQHSSAGSSSTTTSRHPAPLLSTKDGDQDAEKTQWHGTDGEWSEVVNLLAKVAPYLKSKSWETRTAAGQAVEFICREVGIWDPSVALEDGSRIKAEEEEMKDVKPIVHSPRASDNDADPVPASFAALSIPDLLTSGPLLLSSAGTEYRAAGPVNANAKKDMANRIGLGGMGMEMEDMGIDVGKELGADGPQDGDVKMRSRSPSQAPPPARRSPSQQPPLASPSINEREEDLSHLSARERNALKRKRKVADKAGGSIATPLATPLPTPSSERGTSFPAFKKQIVEGPEGQPMSRSDSGKSAKAPSPMPADGVSGDEKPNFGGEVVVVDPAAKIASTAAAAVANAAQELELAYVEGEYPFASLIDHLEGQLASPGWQQRHGAALGLLAIFKTQLPGIGGSLLVEVYDNDAKRRELDNRREAALEQRAVRLVTILARDRFGDYVGDMVVAPVRETVAMALGCVVKAMALSGKALEATVDGLRQMVYWQGVNNDAKASETTEKKGKEGRKGYAWQVRHAGLLGLKYFVATKAAALQSEVASSSSLDFIRAVFNASLLGLADPDDDVRSAAAGALLPIADALVTRLDSAEIRDLLDHLWSVLEAAQGEGGDADLTASVGGVMDLLAKLVSFSAVLEILSPSSEAESTLPRLIPLLVPYLRHPLASVRFAVMRAVQVFVELPSLKASSWMDARILSLLWQVILLERKPDVRLVAKAVWQKALGRLRDEDQTGEALQRVAADRVQNWFTLVNTHTKRSLDTSALEGARTRAAAGPGPGAYDVDKPMVGADPALVTVDEIMLGRLDAADALSSLLAQCPLDCETVRTSVARLVELSTQGRSGMAATIGPLIAEKWALSVSASASTLDQHPLVLVLSQHYLTQLSSDLPVVYDELAVDLRAMRELTARLARSFVENGRLPPSAVGTVPDIREGFSIETTKDLVEKRFNSLLASIGKGVSKREKVSAVAVLEGQRPALRELLASFESGKVQYDVQRAAALASAVVAMGTLPTKISPVIKALTESLKLERSIGLQTRSAVALADFVEIATSPRSPLKNDPSPKIISNLATFLCQDESQTPTWLAGRNAPRGILSAQESGVAGSKVADVPPSDPKFQSVQAARLLGRGASLALSALAARFGDELVERVPKLWYAMSEPVVSLYASKDLVQASDDRLDGDDQLAQQLLDCLTVIPVGAQNLPASSHGRLSDLLHAVAVATQSRFAIVRFAAARTFSSLCAILLEQGMACVIDGVLPIVADPVNVHRRRGAIELIARLVELLDVKILAYVIFLIVPVLGRMSDADDDVRLVATHTFAALIKLVPLEAGVPSPPGFSEEMLERRQAERDFLGQLLGTAKIEDYVLPIKVNAELRKYQRDGISWLAFLAKYQLHGVLCDDMGLGKTLQSICILASKHHERAALHEKTQSPDSVHLPSLVVCPPTLTGHWAHEINTYAEKLRAIVYTGAPATRASLFAKIKKSDVVIMSYDIVRNDIERLAKVAWNYCILDEGHVIKNGKSKLAKAVKQIHAEHRLILSGTPIQNNALELWSLFDFLMPGFLGTERSFNERFGKPISASRDAKSSSKEQEAGQLALEALHKQVLPFLLRRLKEDVLDDLPPKIIQDYYCDLSPLQQSLYEEFSKSKARSQVEGSLGHSNGSDTGSHHVFQALQYLKKLVNHPMLIYQPDNSRHADILAKSGGAKGIHDISHSPKLLALRQLLRDCGIGLTAKGETDAADFGGSGAQHRVLIFCQMKEMLNIIERDVFNALMPSVTYMRLDGSVEATKRHAIVQKFNSDPSIDCLLLTTSVGGLGLNLTGADTVIFVEHDWNPMKDLQAMDRAHRLGQKKVVNVYRLITRATLEEKIMGLQRFKLNIASSVINQQNSSLGSLDPEQILDLFDISAVDDAKAAADAKKRAAAADGPTSQKNVLAGLEDLPPETEYSAYNAADFTSSL